MSDRNHVLFGGTAIVAGLSINFHHLFHGVAPTTLDVLSRHRSTKRFDAQQDVFSAGQSVEWLTHILSGRAKVWRPLSDGHALTLAYMSKGATPGLLACCQHRASPSTLTSVTTLEVERWPAAVVYKLLGEDAILTRNALDIASMYIGILLDKFEDNAGSVERRIGRALLRLAGDDGHWQPTDQATLSLSRQDLADMTGSTLFTASRTLSDWQRRGLVESARGRVTLTDPKGIAAIAELAA